MMRNVRYIFNELMVETQDRGEHATGLSSFKRDGSFELYKAPKNADRMTTNDEEYLKIVNNFNSEETSVVIAHTRYYTKGKPENNNNNHPFHIGNVVGLHNGTVKNDDELFTEYKFDRVGEVDSEIIYQLINHYNNDNITFKGLQKALEDTRLKGLFALAFVHQNDPSTLHLVKQEKPMSIAIWKEAGIVIFNSIDEYIEKAFRKLERLGNTFGFDGKQTVEMVSVKDDTYFTVSANATDFEGAIGEIHRIFLESSTVFTSYGKYGTTTYSSGGCGTTGSSSNLPSTTSIGSTDTTKKVKATDSVGNVFYGEIDKTTGEVIILTEEQYNEEDLGDEMDFMNHNSDDGLPLDLMDTEHCVECNYALTESEKEREFNVGMHQKICDYCADQTMRSIHM
jgi:glucosamine 6-phosphate synthetase-like amidotransferase/phosphosugar isomerase protein